MGLDWYQFLGRRASPLPPAPQTVHAANSRLLYGATTTSPCPTASPPPPSLQDLTDAFFHSSFPIIVSAAFCAFCVVFIVGIYMWTFILRFVRQGRHFQGIEFSSPDYKRRGLGVDRAVVESLPLIPFGGSRIIGTECTVCLRRFAASELLRVLPKCMHAFHVGCVDIWLAGHCTCPICRRVVDPDDLLLPIREELLAGPKAHPSAAAAECANAPEGRLYNCEETRIENAVKLPSPQIPAGKRPRCKSVDDALMLRGFTMLEKEDPTGMRVANDSEDPIVADGETLLQRRWSDIRPEDLRVLRQDVLTVDVEECSTWHGRTSFCPSTGPISSSSSGTGIDWNTDAPGTGSVLFGGRVKQWLSAAAGRLGR